MSLDAYSLCPGGTGKKIKFCCPDFLPELEKIDRMIEGEQFNACLQNIDQLEAKGPIPGLPDGIQVGVAEGHRSSRRGAGLRGRFRQSLSAKLGGLVEAALAAAVSEGGPAAMAKLQRAIGLCNGHIQSRVYEAASVVASVLIHEGHWSAGRALLQFLSTLDPEDRECMERLIAINGSGEIPLLLKCDPPMLPCPPDAPWRAKFEAAMSFMNLAQWQETADRLTALSAETPDAPAVWNNLAVVRSWLADEAGALRRGRNSLAWRCPWKTPWRRKPPPC